MNRARLWVTAAFGLSIGLFAPAVDAHLNSTGMGPLYDGLMHFLLSPEDLVPPFGLALLAGLRGPQQSRRVLLVLPCAWLLGGVLGLHAAATVGSPVVAAAWFLLAGGLVAADARLPLPATTMLAALLGLYHGYFNGTGLGSSFTSLITVVGMVSAVFVLIALAEAFAVAMPQQWARVAVRVVGSWIAASGLLLLGWSLRGQGI